MASKYRTAMYVAIVAGILLLISGISGLATWETVKEFVTDNLTDNAVIQIVFAILIFIASLGGLAVIIGGILIGKENLSTGRFLIMLGAGMGIIGLIVSIYIAYVKGSLTIGSFFSIGFMGLLLSIIARSMAKK